MDAKTLNKLLKEFPWLWAIRQSWCHLEVEVKVAYATLQALLMEIVPIGEAPTIRLWFKFKVKNLSEESDSIVSYRPNFFCHLQSAVDGFKKTFPKRKVEYVVLVYKQGEKEIIQILRPPKPRKIW